MITLLPVAIGLFAGCGSEDSNGKVFFIEPVDGAEVKSPFRVQMGMEGLLVEPAGPVREGYGHHHIIIDTELASPGQPIPSDEQHLHFGKAQTETTLELPAGVHTLRLLFGQGDHVPYDPPLTDTIQVTVLE